MPTGALRTPSTAAAPADPPSFSLADVVLLAVIFIWGTNYTVVKQALGSIPPLAFMSLRFALAALAMAGVLHVREGFTPLPRATWVRLTVLGLVGNTLYQLCFILGISRTTVANTGMLTSGTPILTALLAAVLGVERLRRPLVLGLLLSVPGMLLIVGARGPALDDATRLGDLFILGGSVCWALYTVGLRSLGGELSALRITALTMIIGAPGVVLAGLPAVLELDWRSIGPGAWLGLVYSALISLVASYVVWSRSVRVVGSGKTGIYNSGTPVVAALTGWLVRDERPTWAQCVGALLVISGVLLSRRR